MHNAIAHHSSTDAQLAHEQWSVLSPPQPAAPSLYTGHDSAWYGIPLWPVWVSCPGCVPSQLLVPLQPSCWLGMRSWKILDLVQIWLSNNWKHQCVINIHLILKPKYNTLPATRKKINSIPAETRTVSTLYSIPFTSCSGPTLSNTSQLITITVLSFEIYICAVSYTHLTLPTIYSV